MNSENIQKKECGPDRSVSDNQSSSVTPTELAMKARKSYGNVKLQQRSHTMTYINPMGLLSRIYESKPIIFSAFSEYFS